MFSEIDCTKMEKETDMGPGYKEVISFLNYFTKLQEEKKGGKDAKLKMKQ